MSLPHPVPARFAEALAFMHRHNPAVAEWPMELLERWLWHWWCHAQVGVAGEGGIIRAVGVARCVRTTHEAAAEAYAHHEDATEGSVLWVDQLASTHPLGVPILLAQARTRFGPRNWVSGQVFKRPGELRMLPWNRVERLLQHHGLH